MRSSLFILCSAAALGGARLGAQASAQPAPQLPAASAPATSTAPTASPIPAQPSMTGRRGGRGGMQGALLRGITLSPAQHTQVETIRTRYRDQRRATAGAGAGARDTAGRAGGRGRGRALREQQLSEIRGVLTPDQQATFDRNVAAMRAQHRQQRATATGTTR